MKKSFLHFLAITSMFSIISSCGGQATSSMVSFSPNEPLVLNVDRRIIYNFVEYNIPKPNTQVQLRIDNRNNPHPLTIVGITFVVNGPRGTKVITVDPMSDFFLFEGNNFRPSPRAFFAEVQPFQASYCMSKIEFFHEANNARNCATIANDNSKVTNYGASAANTTDSDDGRYCCPTGNGNLSNLFILAGGLQNAEEENDNPTSLPQAMTLSITANIIGLYGTFANPVANYSTQVFFTARSN